MCRQSAIRKHFICFNCSEKKTAFISIGCCGIQEWSHSSSEAIEWTSFVQVDSLERSFHFRIRYYITCSTQETYLLMRKHISFVRCEIAPHSSFGQWPYLFSHLVDSNLSICNLYGRHKTASTGNHLIDSMGKSYLPSNACQTVEWNERIFLLSFLWQSLIEIEVN